MNGIISSAAQKPTPPHPIQVAASNNNDDARNYSPARAAEAVAVGASNILDARERHSNFGPAVALFAPGQDILSAGIENDDGITRGGRTSAVCTMSFFCFCWISFFDLGRLLLMLLASWHIGSASTTTTCLPVL